jgi:hypothetical protein
MISSKVKPPITFWRMFKGFRNLISIGGSDVFSRKLSLSLLSTAGA